MAKKKRAIRLKRLSEEKTGVREASAVACLAPERFLLVDDERGVFVYAPDEGSREVLAAQTLRDLEGACVAPDGRGFVLAESDGSVHAFTIDAGEPSDARRVGRLPAISERANRGWEGLTWIPSGVAGEEPALAAVHQDKPRVVALFDPRDLSARGTFHLPKRARKALDKLSDLTWNPEAQTLLVLSGRAGRIAELRFANGALELVSLLRVDSDGNDVPEGLCVDDAGTLWVVTDGKGHLRAYRLPEA